MPVNEAHHIPESKFGAFPLPNNNQKASTASPDTALGRTARQTPQGPIPVRVRELRVIPLEFCTCPAPACKYWTYNTRSHDQYAQIPMAPLDKPNIVDPPLLRVKGHEAVHLVEATISYFYREVWTMNEAQSRARNSYFCNVGAYELMTKLKQKNLARAFGSDLRHMHEMLDALDQIFFFGAIGKIDFKFDKKNQ